MFPININCEVIPPSTKFKAWCGAINSLAQLIIMEAIYAGIFVSGFNKTISSKTAEEFFSGLLMALVGLASTTLWPGIIWFFIKDIVYNAWNFKKQS